MGDFHELKLDFRRIWQPVNPGNLNPASVTRRRPTTFSSTSMDHNDSYGHGVQIGGNGSAGGANRLSVAFVAGTAAVLAGAGETEGILTPGARFCHVGVVYEDAFYIFGGYDGSNRSVSHNV
jgi:hypothetical protein